MKIFKNSIPALKYRNAGMLILLRNKWVVEQKGKKFTPTARHRRHRKLFGHPRYCRVLRSISHFFGRRPERLVGRGTRAAAESRRAGSQAG